MKKTIMILGLFLLFSFLIVNAETRNVECTSSAQCNTNEVCVDWKCESKVMPEPTVVSTNSPQDYSSGLTFIVGIGGIIAILLIVIIYLLLRKRKTKK